MGGPGSGRRKGVGTKTSSVLEKKLNKAGHQFNKRINNGAKFWNAVHMSKAVEKRTHQVPKGKPVTARRTESNVARMKAVNAKK